MKFGVIGTNFVSDSFMDGISKVEGCSVTAVTSGRLVNAERFAEKYEIPQVVEAYEDLIYSDVDAVYIATPNVMHFEMAKYFLERQIPVFLEKPMCVHVEEAKQLYELAEQYNTYLHDALMPMYLPGLQTLKEEVKRVGVVRNASFVFSKYSSRYDAFLRGENPTTFRRELGNGALNDLGIYPISVIVSLFGKPTNVMGNSILLSTGVDGASDAILCYEGFNVSLQVSKISDSKQRNEISTEEGMIEIDQVSLLEKVVYTKRKEEELVLSSNKVNPFVYQIENFIDVVVRGGAPLYPKEQSLAVLETLEEIRKACGVSY